MPRIASDASRDVASNATASSLATVVVLFIASAVAAWWLTRRRETDSGAIAWFAAFASVAGCISLTVARHGPPQGFRPGEVFAWTVSGWDRLGGSDLLGSSQFLLNVALFVPAGVAWTWVTGRATRSLAGLIALSMLIESVQAVAGLGAADITDVAANTVGAVVGVVAAAVARAGLQRAGISSAGAHAPPASPRRRAFVAAGMVVLTVASLTALLAGADRRQARIRDELENAFLDTSYDEIDAVLRGDPDGLDADAQFTDGEQIFSAVSVRADGFRYTDDQIELRWPALFFGFRRCVYVIWQPTSVEFRNLSGPACTDFIG